MALEEFIVGTSPSGNLTEAIQDALKEARKDHDEKKKWVIEKIAQNRLDSPKVSVVIRVGEGDGDNGIGPREK